MIGARIESRGELMKNHEAQTTTLAGCVILRAWSARLLIGLMGLMGCIGFIPLAEAKPLQVGANLKHELILAPYLSVLEDPGQQLTLHDLQKPAIASRFQASPAGQHGRELNFGFTRSAWWLRLHLVNNSEQAQEYLLEIAFAHLEQIQVFQPDKAAIRQVQRAGTGVPFVAWPYPNRYPVFPLSLPAGSEKIIYLRVQSESQMQIPARLWTHNQYHAHELADYMVQAGFFGLALALIIFNLLLYITLRRRSYLWYVIYSSCAALTLACHTGLVNELLQADAGRWMALSTQTGLSLATAGLILFMRRMLNTKIITPRLDRLLKWLLGIHLTIPLLLIVSFFHGIRLALIFDAITAVIILITSLIAALQRRRIATFFVASVALTGLSMLLYTFHAFNLMPGSFLSRYGFQLGTAIQMLILAWALLDQYYVMRREKAQAQASAWQAQQHLVANLKSSGHALEQQVAQRTAELSENNTALLHTHAELQSIYQAAQASRHQAEQAEQQAALSLADLRQAQAQLVQSEKMAALGNLIAGVAHEINTPLGAVKSSSRNISSNMMQALYKVANLHQSLDAQQLPLFLKLLACANAPVPVRSTREERALIQQTTPLLEALGVPAARHQASMLVQLHAHANYQEFLPFLLTHQSSKILDCAFQMSNIIHGAENINLAVHRVAKIIFALKSFSQFDPKSVMESTQLSDGIETVLRIYQSQFGQGVHLVREYETIPPLLCFPDQLNQVWTNLLQNALHAINYQGTITIRIAKHADEQGNFACISISDTGVGIPAELQDKIFEAFFTTKPPGEGTGLGLDMVKKIIDQHHGRIELDSRPGQGSRFTVFLPYRQSAAAEGGAP
jgi:signal transduction histidine kinase